MLDWPDRKIGDRARTHLRSDLAVKCALPLLAVLDCGSIGFDVPALHEQFHRQRRYSCPQDLGSQWCQIHPEGGLHR